jgi:hypothetical protein
MDSNSSASGGSTVSAQWQLNETADSVIAVARGVLRAATSDNVQPIAILAANAFGATLAICQETQLKVRRDAMKHKPTYVVNFLRSTIGYAKDDCAIQLASSNSGLRFLGLAATLHCTASNFIGAQALELMITSSAGQNQELPTVPQLQELLSAVEYKVNRTGFAESIIGWETYLTEHPDVSEEFRTYSRASVDHPSIESLKQLVDALRDLDRLGSASSVHIKAGTCCPWVIAFIKWCLGMPPTVILEDGTVLLQQDGARVIVTAAMRLPEKDLDIGENIENARARGVDFEIAIYQELSEPSLLWACPGLDQRAWHGMVPITSFGKRTLREYGLLRNRAMMEALTYSLKLVSQGLQVEESSGHALATRNFLRKSSDDDEATERLPPELAQHRIGLFPNDHHLVTTLAEFLDLPDDGNSILAGLCLKECVLDLPRVAAHVRNLKANCRCSDCTGQLAWGPGYCGLTAFKDALAQITADLLALSLLNGFEQILVHAGSLRSAMAAPLRDFVGAVKEILYGEGQATCSMFDILDTALSLVGHNVSDRLRNGLWIASEARGQVIYPQILDTAMLDNQGILRLGGGPGRLVHDGQHYSLVCGQRNREWGTAFKSQNWNDKPVDRLLNLMPSEKLGWQVSKGDKVLYLTCGTTSVPKVFNPYLIIVSAACSLFVTNCPHEETTILEKPDTHSYYVTPMFRETHKALRNALGPVQDIGVVPVYKDETLRFFALANGIAGVIRGPSACLQCCLDICRQAELQYVVL